MKLFISFFLLTSWCFSQVTDIDGNTYKTVIIGTQTWFAEDLKVTRFNNGDEIPNLNESEYWRKSLIKANDDKKLTQQIPGYCNYDNLKKIPPLYNSYVSIDRRNVCPSGYRVPTLRDMNILIEYLGGINDAGIKLKSKTGWILGGNNLSGFNLDGRGSRAGTGEFDNKFQETTLLTSSTIPTPKDKEYLGWEYLISTVYFKTEKTVNSEKLKITFTYPGFLGTIRCLKE